MKVLLDTNAYSALKRGVDAVVRHVTRAETVFLSTIVAGELLAGFRQGTRLRKNLAELEAFIDNHHVTVVPVSLVTADPSVALPRRSAPRGARFPRTISGSRRTPWRPAPTCCRSMSISSRSTAWPGLTLPRSLTSMTTTRMHTACNACFEGGSLQRAGIGMAQPFTVGATTGRGNAALVLVGLNPGAAKDGGLQGREPQGAGALPRRTS